MSLRPDPVDVVYFCEAQPERNLLSALFNRAIMDLGIATYSQGNLADIRTAREWFNSDDSEVVPFSFRWVCRQLDFDADTVFELVRKRYPESLQPVERSKTTDNPPGT